MQLSKEELERFARRGRKLPRTRQASLVERRRKYGHLQRAEKQARKEGRR